MPDRMLRESIIKSEQIAELSYFERLLFIYLILTADDYGNADARPRLVKAATFPLDDVTAEMIEDALYNLEEKKLIKVYEVEGTAYLNFPTWHKHQKLEYYPLKRPIPPPPWEDFEDFPENTKKAMQKAQRKAEGWIPVKGLRESLETQEKKHDIAQHDTSQQTTMTNERQQPERPREHEELDRYIEKQQRIHSQRGVS